MFKQPAENIRSSFVAFALLTVALLALFFPSWKTMAHQWLNSETYSHGILIAPIALWLMWRTGFDANTLENRWQLLGFLWIVLSACIWIAGNLVGANLLEHAGIVGMLMGLFPVVFGKRITLQWLFAIGFLVFMIPAGEFLNPILMDYTADATVWALRASGIAVFREGLHFALPSGRWSVVEACSGLRYIIAALVLALLFAHLNFRSFGKRALFVAASIIVSVIANYVRAYTVVLVGHWSNMKYGTGDDHVYYGWVFFGIVMVLVAWAGSKWSDLKDKEVTAQTNGRTNVVRETKISFSTNFFMGLLVLVVFILSAYAPRYLRGATSLASVESVVTMVAPEWRLDRRGFVPNYKGATSSYQGVTNESARIDVFIGQFVNQDKNAEMISDDNSIVSAADGRWSVKYDQARVEQIDGVSLNLGEMLLYRGESQRLVWYWFTVGPYTYSGRAGAKLGILPSILLGHGDNSTVTTLSTPIDADIPSTRKRLLGQARLANEVNRKLTQSHLKTP